MKWKPDETDIIDYLYESMPIEKRTKFEAHLKENPELQKELNELRRTQKVLPSFQDEEVIPPVPIPGTMTASLRSKRNWLYPVSIAASIAIILLTGYFTNFRMSFNDGGFEVGFIEPQLNQESLTQEEVAKMIAAGLSTYDEKLNGRFTNLSASFDAQLVANQESTEQQIRRVSQKSAPGNRLDESQVLQFIEQLQKENNKMMQNFYKVSAEEQQTYLRNVLLDYSEYLEKQRQEDIQYIQASLRDLRSDSDLKQEATDKILANIISSVNNQNSPINDRQSLD